jgi:hypothetical protein
MPRGAMLEMIADWFGAARAYEGKWPEKGKWGWLENNLHKINIHSETRKEIEEVLKDKGVM